MFLIRTPMADSETGNGCDGRALPGKSLMIRFFTSKLLRPSNVVLVTLHITSTVVPAIALSCVWPPRNRKSEMQVEAVVTIR